MATVTACTIPEVIDMVRRSGLSKVADRMDYLYKLPVDNDDDPMSPDSARLLVSFLMKYQQEIPMPEIAMSPEGHVYGDWEFTKDSNASALFLPSGDVRFACASRDTDTGFFKAREMGTITPDDTFKKITAFANDTT